MMTFGSVCYNLREKIRRSLKRAQPPVDTEAELCNRLRLPMSEIQQRWGIERLRAGQSEAIGEILLGRDVLVVMPTGSGKSLIYQLASQCLPGLTIVVSPLIALMSDQLRSLANRGVAAVCLNSHLTAEQNEEALAAVLSGQTRLLYLSPERLRSEKLCRQLAAAGVGLFVVDEAHCISEWGHDFRPDYQSLVRVVESLNRPPVVALTATATPAVRQEIERHLQLRTPLTVATGYDRPNLVFICLPTRTDQKMAKIQAMLADCRGPVLIYAGTRRACEEMSRQLSASLDRLVLCYHAGMTADARREASHTFTHHPNLVMIATNAFGMGVDRPDLSLVIHHTLPGSLEAYYQEAGRAGRGGQPSSAVLLYDPSDRGLHDYFIRQSTRSREDYQKVLSLLPGLVPVGQRALVHHLEREGAVAASGAGWRALTPWSPELADRLEARGYEVRKTREKLLEAMVDYAETSGCRRRRLVGHFGQVLTEVRRPCCDNCRRSYKAD